MVNVICVKWGTKYDSDITNRLYKMVSRNISIPFKFYCYTENASGLNNNINIIPIPDNYLEIYWNKLAMFQKDFVPPGPCLYFDHDVIIQNNIDHLFEYLSNDLTMVRAYWKGNIMSDGSHRREKDRWNMYANSSVLLWNSNNCVDIWNHFQKDPDYFMVQYKGIDRFIFHEKMKINFFPKGIIYSRIFGETENDFSTAELTRNKIKETGDEKLDYDVIYLHHIKDRTICLFNGPKYDWLYEGFEHYWS